MKRNGLSLEDRTGEDAKQQDGTQAPVTLHLYPPAGEALQKLRVPAEALERPAVGFRTN